MIMKLNARETNALLEAVHHYLMHLRNLDATGSDEHNAIIGIAKFLIATESVDLDDGLPF